MHRHRVPGRRLRRPGCTGNRSIPGAGVDSCASLQPQWPRRPSIRKGAGASRLTKSRGHDVEPEVVVIEQSEELVDGLLAAVDLDVTRIDGLVERGLAELDVVERR